MRRAAADVSIRVVVVAATGPSFSVAGDLVTALPGPPSPVPAADGAALLATMRDLPRPLVAVVQENRITPQNGDTLLAYTCIAR